jgi:hypothetical protein
MAKATRQMQSNRKVMTATPQGQGERFILADRSTRVSIEVPE